MRKFSIPVFALGTVFLTLPVTGAITVYGKSDAKQCYESTRFGRGFGEMAACNRALRDPALSKRARAATFVNRGILFNHRKRADEAIKDFNSALKIDPTLGAAYLNRGNSMFFRRRIKAALEDYTRAIRYNVPDLHVAYFNRGITIEVLGRTGDARNDFEKALELKPEFEAARTMLSELPHGNFDKQPKDAPAGS